jgi:SAM-dependent methyltransferase
MSVDYDHSQNIHTLEGPRIALPLIFADAKPRSLLDVGCGLGTWLNAALEFGIPDVFGVDGVGIARDKLLVPEVFFRQHDLTKPWSLGRRFDVVLCLEVGEHLEEEYAAMLVDSLVGHSDLIYFSAAVPGQPGQHHVNCQWPGYWQNLFNKRGFACSDALRWKIWDNKNVECWYRQNLFSARKDPRQAGKEPRLPAVLHPEISELIIRGAATQRIEEGRMRVAWYARIPFLALKHKLMRRLFLGRTHGI